MSARWFGIAALLLTLALTGCKDEGREKYLSARAQYLALVDKGTHPADPAWEPVRQKLASVPKDSNAYKEAQDLLAVIEKGRRLPEKPLAITPGGLSPTEEACAALAKQLGAADGGERVRLEEALARCRQKLEREKATSHPEGESGHEH